MAATTEFMHRYSNATGPVSIPDGYHVVLDADGVLTGIEPDTPRPSLTQAALSYATARAGEPSTYAGVGIGTIGSQVMAGNVIQAVTAGLAGDYVGMIQHAAPVVVVASTAIMSVLHKESDANLEKLVAGMSREELLKICNL
jgi:hypothetical protein